MEGHCQKGYESMEDQGKMGQRQGEMERSLQDPATPNRETLAKSEKYISSEITCSQLETSPHHRRRHRQDLRGSGHFRRVPCS